MLFLYFFLRNWSMNQVFAYFLSGLNDVKNYDILNWIWLIMFVILIKIPQRYHFYCSLFQSSAGFAENIKNLNLNSRWFLKLIIPILSMDGLQIFAALPFWFDAAARSENIQLEYSVRTKNFFIRFLKLKKKFKFVFVSHQYQCIFYIKNMCDL